MMSNYSGLTIIKSEFVPKGVSFISGNSIYVGPPLVSREIYEIFHQGKMLDVYEYIGEGPGSVMDMLFGYH